MVDPNPLNWLYITYNSVEEAVRVTKGGKIRPAAMTRYRWLDDRTLEVHLRDECFADGSSLDAGSFQRAVTEQLRWQAPHPPGTHFNIDRAARAEIVDRQTVRLHLPAVDGLVLGKLRATHVMTERFWADLGFGYARERSGEGIGESSTRRAGGARDPSSWSRVARWCTPRRCAPTGTIAPGSRPRTARPSYASGPTPATGTAGAARTSRRSSSATTSTVSRPSSWSARTSMRGHDGCVRPGAPLARILPGVGRAGKLHLCKGRSHGAGLLLELATDGPGG